ncbi:Aldo/keto reductase [Byssothecium circinans]|uniref:Aldo/keto reductase n=1 Tax=Byssothecium circinans TaxID=147558 RepID=A0A6A5U287_9PLEO|nr:Aldo/keto reductase [Byssothecium circinans]
MNVTRLSTWLKALPIVNFQQPLRQKTQDLWSNRSMPEIPCLRLSDGNLIPLLGFGTGTAWFKDGDEDKPVRGELDTQLISVLKEALKAGFMHLDCAQSYGNEKEIEIAIKESGVPRNTLFITSKVQEAVADIPGSLEGSLQRLQTDYLDLFLIHTPYYTKDPAELQRAWKAMEDVKKTGKVKSIGVSNFQKPHLETILRTAKETPVVNQIEYHPYLQRSGNYLPWLKEHGIEVSSFKDLAPITVAKGGPLDATLAKIAEEHGVSAEVVLLRWHIERGVVPVTTTSGKERMVDYLKAVDLRLSPEEVEEISRVGSTHHFRWWGKQFFESGDRA